MISSSGHHHFVVRHFNGLGGFGFRFGFGFRPDGIRIGRVVITVQEADGRQAVEAEVLIQQMPPADVVGALRTLVRCTPRPMELPVVNVLALVITGLRA
jgi:hypothetical protein